MKEKRWCPLSGVCGGCDSTNGSYSTELIMKEELVRKYCGRFGRISEIIPSPSLTRFRCKVQAVCGRDRDGKFITGQYRKGSHKLISVRSCVLEDGRATAVLQTVRQMAQRFNIAPYDEDRRTGDLRHILIRVSHASGETLVALVTAAKDFPHRADLVSAIHQKNPFVSSVVQIINNRDTNMVVEADDEEILLYGRGYITEELCGLRFDISAKSFFQTNPEQTENLYRTAMKLARIRSTDRVLDAYSGTGTIAITAAREGAGEVIGVESNPRAVKDAVRNAAMNGAENVRFVNDDASKYLKEARRRGEKFDIIFLDPPRAGSTEEFLAAASKTGAEGIVYISCNPETLGRDLRYLTRFTPYRVLEIQPVDMFPGSGEHVETVVLLGRDDSKED